MLPNSVLASAINQPILIEVKNGETYNGDLVSCDNWMNLILKRVIWTSSEGEKFKKMKECYIRGNNIKYVRLSEQVLDKAHYKKFKADTKA